MLRRMIWGIVAVFCASSCSDGSGGGTSDASPAADAATDVAADTAISSDSGATDVVSDGPTAEEEAVLADNPLEAAAERPGEWVFVPVEGALCMDGSATGFGARIAPGASRLVIFLQGGGACFTAFTCNGRSSFGEADVEALASEGGQAGIFDASDEDNPLADAHFIFVPYCTGDVHGGSREGVDVPNGPSDRDFVGYRNIGAYLDFIVPYFGDLEDVLLTGVSAGGFGATLNYDRVAHAFAPVPVTLLNDSGPFLPNDDALAPCLQQIYRDLWGLDEILPEVCAGCREANGDGLSNIMPALAAAYPEARFGLLSNTGDLVIRAFFAAGNNDCEGGGGIPEPVFRAGLEALRDDQLAPTGRWATFYTAGPSHTFLGGNRYVNARAAGVALRSWIADLLAGTAVDVAAP